MSGAPESSIWCRSCYKNTLSTYGRILLISASFFMFLMALGPISMTSAALETGLKFNDFCDGFPWSGLELRQYGHRLVFGIAIHCSNQTVWSSSSTCKIQHETCRKNGIRKNQMQTMNMRCNMISLKQRNQDTG